MKKSDMVNKNMVNQGKETSSYIIYTKLCYTENSSSDKMRNVGSVKNCKIF